MKESDETLEKRECQTEPEKLWPTRKCEDHKTYSTSMTQSAQGLQSG